MITSDEINCIVYTGVLHLTTLLCYSVEYSSGVGKEMMHLLRLPVDQYNNVLTVLQLEHYTPLLQCFDYHGRKTLSVYLINNALNSDTYINTPEQVA